MTAPEPPPERSRRFVVLAVGGLGVSAVMTQLALMRELYAAFSGNELVLGICLGNWLLLTGAGTWVGRLLLGGRATPAGGPSAARDTPGQLKLGITHSAASFPTDAAGADAGRLARWLIIGQIAVALLPLGQVAAVRVLRDVVFGRGAAVGVVGTVLGSFGFLLPFCLVSGALLTLASALLARPGPPPSPGDSAPPARPAGESAGALGRVYLADTAGGVAGGVLFSLVLVPRFDHFALLCFPAFLNLAVAAVIAARQRAWFLLEAAIAVIAGLAVHVALVDADFVTTALQHRDETLVFRANSPYGRLVVGDRDGLLTFYESGVPVAATENTAQVEEAVLYALCQRAAPREVLLIGGGVAGAAREIRQASPDSAITYVELDPAIIAAGRKLLPRNLDDPRLQVVLTDGRRLVRQARGRYDFVLVDLPDPATSQLNRFYTEEFFGEARRALAPGGVLAFGLGHYENYVSPALARLLSSAYHTLTRVFPEVVMIPGGRVFFLASDQSLDLDIAARLERHGLHPRLVNRHYLEATLAADRLADLERAVARPAALNTDFNPALYYYTVRHWLSQFSGRSSVLGGALALLLCAYLVRLRAVPRLLFAAGFAASGLEVVLLLGFQIVYGSVYRQVGLVVTVFMAGLAVGAWWAGRRALGITTAGPRTAPAKAAVRRKEDSSPPTLPMAPPPSSRRAPGLLPRLALGIALLAAALPWLVQAPERLDAWTGASVAGQGLILLTTLVLAVLVGAQFPLAGAAARGEPAAVAARLFSADLVGAALGALLVSALLIPLLGVTAVCLLTAALNAGAAALAWRSTTA